MDHQAPSWNDCGHEMALGQQRAAGDRRLWLIAQLKGLPTAARNRDPEQGLAPGQGAWGWAQSPAIQLLLSQSEFNKSVCPSFVGVDVLTAKGASFMVWACVCLGDTSFPCSV